MGQRPVSIPGAGAAISVLPGGAKNSVPIFAFHDWLKDALVKGYLTALTAKQLKRAIATTKS
jgi:hypothetical protein